ncbi:hypothetical protein STEG23_000788, partial [Scotinomys teguina]
FVTSLKTRKSLTAPLALFLLLKIPLTSEVFYGYPANFRTTLILLLSEHKISFPYICQLNTIPLVPTCRDSPRGYGVC